MINVSMWGYRVEAGVGNRQRGFDLGRNRETQGCIADIGLVGAADVRWKQKTRRFKPLDPCLGRSCAVYKYYILLRILRQKDLPTTRPISLTATCVPSNSRMLTDPTDPSSLSDASTPRTVPGHTVIFVAAGCCMSNAYNTFCAVERLVARVLGSEPPG